ncbi:ABC-type transport auxiliary lipoprotein family protein [Alteriqipengyuania flavescens]|uniref:ABC-type transport auxiliary lipoprotein family protein n=1 Tax=Alteriqipengyuania flavescens TaxID=3053610 RepID=UPI0025B4F847|nr:ABC-type transport auxiliary lipoprotein family protein [Alteriqipengyuania flavescens]WJY19150.1 ABC-type transport auxiliary lipoprotein family protein [Alteriqipengyuania flavescens]WJY25090.1 ABC-type transport auxiliary lipoprotein family protein [Alteriqipengyuania flavescens]
MTTTGNKTMKSIRMLVALPVIAALSACISFGDDPPESLFDLTPQVMRPAGSGSSGLIEQAIGVSEVDAPKKLAVQRVPVQIDAANVAYLQDALWVERPTRLFTTLLAETLRARTDRLVVDTGNAQVLPDTKLTGTLREMGYDVATSSVIVRFDAMLTTGENVVRTRRFESRISGVAPQAAAVGPALNQAANEVAIGVADWAGGA